MVPLRRATKTVRLSASDPWLYDAGVPVQGRWSVGHGALPMRRRPPRSWLKLSHYASALRHESASPAPSSVADLVRARSYATAAHVCATPAPSLNAPAVPTGLSDRTAPLPTPGPLAPISPLMDVP